jgi:prefoldin subunit 5
MGIQPPVAPLTKEAELQYLESLRSYLQNLLKQVEDRINELKSSK